MRTASYRVSDLQRFVIPLGFVGENEHCQIIFLAEDAYAEYPNAAVSLTVRPPYGEPYPAVVTRDGNNVLWTVKDSDLTRSGQGEIQLSFTTGDVVAKTYVGKTKICRSIQPTGEVPDPIEDFLTEAGAALTAIPETINTALEAAKESGEFDGPQGPEGPAGQDGQPGADGYSPTITVTDITGGHRLTITDKNGTRTVDVMDGEDGAPGQDGQDGAPGADGFSPVITVTDITGGHRLTITTATETQTVDVMDGSGGDPTTIIDDTSTALDKVWSANKTNGLLSAINVSQPTAQNSDIGKFLKLKTIDQNGKPTEFEYGEGGGTVTDVTVAGSSVLDDGVAKVPLASTSAKGVVQVAEYNGTSMNNGVITLASASSSQIKDGSRPYNPIVPSTQHRSVFYGLAKAAGADMSGSSNAVGTYTDTAKSAIKAMLGISDIVYSGSEWEFVSEDTWTMESGGDPITAFNVPISNSGVYYDDYEWKLVGNIGTSAAAARSVYIHTGTSSPTVYNIASFTTAAAIKNIGFAMSATTENATSITQTIFPSANPWASWLDNNLGINGNIRGTATKTPNTTGGTHITITKFVVTLSEAAATSYHYILYRKKHGNSSKVTILTPTGNTHTLAPCPVTYDFGEKSELTVTVTADTQYHFKFSSPSGTPCVLTINGITGKMGDAIEAGKTYMVGVWAGIALIKEVVVTAVT